MVHPFSFHLNQFSIVYWIQKPAMSNFKVNEMDSLVLFFILIQILQNEQKIYSFLTTSLIFWAELTIGKLKRQFGLFQAFNSQCGLITLT